MTNMFGMGVQNHQIDQLKEEISGKDLALVKEHFDHMKVSHSCCSLFLHLTIPTWSICTQLTAGCQ